MKKFKSQLNCPTAGISMVLLIATLSRITNCSIVDVQSPIVIYSNGAVDNYFGYSLAYMKGHFGNRAIQFEASTDRATLFIGAPNETRFTKNSGIIWQCSFTGLQARLTCSPMSSISDQTLSSPSSCLNPTEKMKFPEPEAKQLIGVSISTSNNVLIAGAPRMKINGFRHNDCYKETALIGGYYRTVGEEIQDYAPLDSPGSYYYPDAGISEYWFLFGEAGFSSDITPNEHVLLGTPGNRKWKGGVLEYESGSQRPILHNYKGEFSEVKAHSQLGYSVSSGMLRGQQYIASGAPRGSNMRGLVVVIINSKPQFFEGSQFGSNFGYALATADVNGDGNDEVLIGAPLSTPDLKSISSQGTGCMVIYDLSKSRKFPLVELCLSKLFVSSFSSGARFGSAICKLGDLNNDMKMDFAVSAPYDDNQIGSVFIFYGGDHVSIIPAQVIRGKTFKIPNLHGFGTELLNSRSPADLDGNGTPDLAIGAYESAHVIVLRTRPHAELSMAITFHTADSDQDAGRIDKLTPGMNKFRARVCIQFVFPARINVPKDVLLNVWQKYSVDERVEFGDKSNENAHQSQVKAVGVTCMDKELLVVSEDQQSTDQTQPIQFHAKIHYNDTYLNDNMHFTVTPANLVLPQTRAQNQEVNQDRQYQEAYESFRPYDPSPIAPTSKAESLQVATDNCESDGVPSCSPKLVLGTSIYYNEGASQDFAWQPGKVMTIGKLESLLLHVMVENQGETAYRPTINVQFSIPEEFETDLANAPQFDIRSESRCKRTSSAKSQLTVSCQHTQPLQQKRKMTFIVPIVNLKELRLLGDNTKVNFHLKVQAYPDVRGLKSQYIVENDSELPLEEDVKVSIESNPDNMHEKIRRDLKLIDFVQTITVKNFGYTSTALRQVKAIVKVPYKLAKGSSDEILKIRNPSTLDVACKAEGFEFYIPSVDDLKFLDKSNGSANNNVNRITRSTKSKPVSSEKSTLPESSDKFITLSGCDKSSAQISCAIIVCTMDLPSKGSREIRLQMYFNKTTGNWVNDETKGIRLQTFVTVGYRDHMKSEPGLIQREFASERGVPAWVYLGAGAGGTILFLLLTFALFKCGFFRRKTKEQLQQLKRRTMQGIDGDALLQLDASIDEAEEIRDD